MGTYPTTHDTANGPLSYWMVHIPTTAPGGLVAAVRLWHGDHCDQRDGHTPSLHVTLVDRDGSWVKTFASPEDWCTWLAGITRGAVRRVNHQQRPSRHLLAEAAV